MLNQDSTHRFSSRVKNYVRYRPGYPREIIGLLKKECGLQPEHVIADIACGTGIFTKLLLENGNRVIGVEPNAEMRKAGEEYLKDYPNFDVVVGTAEATTLPAQSIHIVTAAQAAHWFDRRKAHIEFQRILRPHGWLVLIWNERRVESAFGYFYEQLLQTYGTDYAQVQVRDKSTMTEIAEFFEPASFKEFTFPSEQQFDYAGLLGRLLSSSYAPEAGHPQHESMLRALQSLFNQYQQNGYVAMEYNTKVYFGQLT